MFSQIQNIHSCDIPGGCNTAWYCKVWGFVCGVFFLFFIFLCLVFLSYFVPSGVCALVVQFFKITMYLLFH